jgi:tRNA G18 (ribose-2'-O)-methylase SpoU
MKPSETISLTELNLNKNDNAILVLGSEAFGISTNLDEIANYNLYIPPLLNKEMVNKHPFDLIDSLNVGVSAGILINHIKNLLKV